MKITTVFFSVLISFFIGVSASVVESAGPPPPPELKLTAIPSSVTFGVIPLNTTEENIITFRNDSAASLRITGVTVSGTDSAEFKTQNDTCTNDTLEPTGICTVGITFTPVSSSLKHASLDVATNLAASAIHVALTGNYSANAIVSSPNSTIAAQTVTGAVTGAPAGFHISATVSFDAIGVSNNADFNIFFPSLPSKPVIYKVIGGTWKKIYPDNQCTGVTNVLLSGNILSFNILDNSECDGASTTAGIIQDPVVVGSASSSGGGGGGGCFIGGRQNMPTAFADTAVMMTPLFVVMILRSLRRRKK